MLASMGSSKSLLKGDIEKVDEANAEEATDADLKARSPIPSQGRKNPRNFFLICPGLEEYILNYINLIKSVNQC
jgi:hypothetical protein